MQALSDLADRWVAWAGLPLAVLAWLVASGSVIAMAFVLRRHGRRDLWPAALFAGGLALAGHGADITVTFWTSPDLALESNEMWLAIVRGLGLPVAIAYGITGQICVILLSAELYAWYRLVRERYWPPPDAPDAATSFVGFLRGFGAGAPRRFGVAWGLLAAMGAFTFAMLGPFFLYIAYLNSIVVSDFALHDRLPQPLPASLTWLAILVACFFAGNWRDFRRRARAVVPPTPSVR